MAKTPHPQNPSGHSTPQNIAEICEDIYSRLIDLICTLQVFKPLREAAQHREDYATLETLAMLQRDFTQQCNELEKLAHIIRKAVSTDDFRRAFATRCAKILKAERTDHVQNG